MYTQRFLLIAIMLAIAVVITSCMPSDGDGDYVMQDDDGDDDDDDEWNAIADECEAIEAEHRPAACVDVAGAHHDSAIEADNGTEDADELERASVFTGPFCLHGPAPLEEHKFIIRTRSAIDAGTSTQFWTDFTAIRHNQPRFGPYRATMPTPGQCCIRESFVWVPHLSFETQPVCPGCESNARVSSRRKAKWVSKPAMIFGPQRTKFLDTMKYHCDACNSWFKGTNPVSVSLAPVDIIACFPLCVIFFLCPR